MTAYASPFDPPPGGHFIYPAGEKPLYVIDAAEWAALAIERAKKQGEADRPCVSVAKLKVLVEKWSRSGFGYLADQLQALIDGAEGGKS